MTTSARKAGRKRPVILERFGSQGQSFAAPFAIHARTASRVSAPSGVPTGI
jgi:hypothetical protein